MRLLPPGYVWGPEGKVVKDPDERVREAIPLIFRKFQETWSVRQTFLWFQNEGVELPVNKSGPKGMKVIWQLPTIPFIYSVLHNPFYAGAYVWGQRPVELKLVEGRLLRCSGRLRAPEECKVFIRDHHEGYIDWETYQENRRRMRQNNLRMEGDEGVAAVRAGQGVLVGVLRCGRCGRKIHVRYWGKRGTAARYLCPGDFASGGRYCLGFGGGSVDRRFGEELLRVISPLGVRASLRAIERLSSERDETREPLRRQAEQLEYEAGRAREQYDEVDPRNRLVAAELERRWNLKIEELEEVKARLRELESRTEELTDEEEAAILELGENFEKVWTDERCPVEVKKKIIRTVIEEVLVDLDEEGQTLKFTVYWKGGTHTTQSTGFPRPTPKTPEAYAGR